MTHIWEKKKKQHRFLQRLFVNIWWVHYYFNEISIISVLISEMANPGRNDPNKQNIFRVLITFKASEEVLRLKSWKIEVL